MCARPSVVTDNRSLRPEQEGRVLTTGPGWAVTCIRVAPMWYTRVLSPGMRAVRHFWLPTRQQLGHHPRNLHRWWWVWPSIIIVSNVLTHGP